MASMAVLVGAVSAAVLVVLEVVVLATVLVVMSKV